MKLYLKIFSGLLHYDFLYFRLVFLKKILKLGHGIFGKRDFLYFLLRDSICCFKVGDDEYFC